jgi:hypothetical protein
VALTPRSLASPSIQADVIKNSITWVLSAWPWVLFGSGGLVFLFLPRCPACCELLTITYQ